MTTLLDDVEAPLLDDEGVPLTEDVVELSEEDADFVHQLVLKILIFVDELAGHPLHPYQRDFAYRVIESVVINDGEELTALFSRQSGKTRT